MAAKKGEVPPQLRAHVFKDGNRANPGGRPKGSKDCVTILRSQVLAALEEAGGEGGAQAYLLAAAKEDRKTFLGLVQKLLPSHVEGDVDVNDTRSRDEVIASIVGLLAGAGITVDRSGGGNGSGTGGA